MNKYIGVKIVDAEPMTQKAFRQTPYDEPDDQGEEQIETDGYAVTYPDGYKSWCPKAQFEEANRACDAMPFGHAIEAARKGLKIARAGWNGKGMFVFLSYPETIQAENIRKVHRDALNASDTDSAMIVLPCFCMKVATGEVLFGWLASQTDMLADDWKIVE